MLLKKLMMTAAAALCAAPMLAAAQAQCSIEIDSNDQMKFDKTEIAVSKKCKDFTVKLKHVGKLPKTAMGHNWVLSKTADVQGAATDGIAAGLDKDYIKPGDARVIAHTKIIGPGETTSVTFPVSKLSDKESYTFYCSFPGHFGVMKGALKLN